MVGAPAELLKVWSGRDSSELVGQVLGGSYRVVSPLDEGAMGTVFIAEHVRLHRQVAVKVLARHSVDFPQALERFELEAEAISRLSHPHVVQVLDFDHTEHGAPYLVMELLAGESLERRLERGPLDLDTAITVALQIASGLGAAHAASIVHRDLKPGNVFLVAMPDLTPFAKLLDFGISKKLDGSRKLTGQFDVIGTPDYMSPEQARGAAARVDQKGDQFSLAVIVFEMLSGEVPFTANNLTEVLHKVIHEPAPRLVGRVPGLPPAVDGVLQRALEKHPDDRFPDVGAFAAQLAVASGRSLGRSSAPCPEGSGRRSIAQSAPTVVASAAPGSTDPLSELVDCGAALTRGPDSAIRPKEPPEPQPRSGARNDPAPSVLILSELSQAHAALACGDVALSWAHVENARSIAAGEEDAPALLELIYADTELAAGLLGLALGRSAQLGAGRTGVERIGPARHLAVSADKALNPKEAFLLSRFHEGDTLEQMIDLSPMPRHETLWLLASLVRRGVVRGE